MTLPCAAHEVGTDILGKMREIQQNRSRQDKRSNMPFFRSFLQLLMRSTRETDLHRGACCAYFDTTWLRVR